MKEPTTPATVIENAPTKWTLLAYGGLGMPLCLAEIPIVTYLPAFYAKELGLSAGLVGAVFLSARLWDGFADVLTGWLSDRSMSRWGRRKPWVIVGAPFLIVATWFLCHPPQGAGLIYLALWSGLFYMANATTKIPYLSWGTELSSDYVQRSRVSAYRETFFMLGNLFFVSAPLVFLADDAPLGDVLFLIAVTVLFLVPLAVLPLGLWVRDPPPAQKTETHLLRGLAVLAKDRVLVRFAVAILFLWTANGVVNSLAVFSFTVGLQLPNKLLWIFFIIYVTALCALPATMRLAGRTEKHKLFAGAMVIQLVVNVGLLLAPMGNFPVVAALWILSGIGASAIWISPTSILADIIDRGEVTTGHRRSGAYVAIYNLMVKIGLALGVGLSFGLLELVDYDPSAAHYSAADARNIRLLGFGLTPLLLIPAIALIWKHPIARKVQRQLRAQIDARNDAGLEAN